MDAVVEGPNFEFSTETREVRSCSTWGGATWAGGLTGVWGVPAFLGTAARWLGLRWWEWVCEAVGQGCSKGSHVLKGPGS